MMRKKILKISIWILIFLTGVTGTAVWLDNPSTNLDEKIILVLVCLIFLEVLDLTGEKK